MKDMLLFYRICNSFQQGREALHGMYCADWWSYMTSNEVGKGQCLAVASGSMEHAKSDIAGKRREVSLFTLIVRVYPKRAIFAEKLSWTLACFSSEMGMNTDDVRIVLVPADPADCDSPMLKAASACTDPVVDICAGNMLADIIRASEYVMVVNQGDSFVGTTALQLVELLRERKHDIVRVRLSLKEGKALATWNSAYVAPFLEVLEPRGIILKSSYVTNSEALLAHDLRVSSMLVKAVMDAGGFFSTSHVVMELSKERIPLDKKGLVEFANELAEYSKAKYGDITDYVQYCIAAEVYDLISNQGSKQEALGCLEFVDDETILQHKRFNMQSKLYALNLKHGKNILDECFVDDDGFLYWGETQLFRANGPSRLKISITSIENDEMTFQGTTDLEMLGDNWRLYVADNQGTEYPLTIWDYHVGNTYGLEGEVLNAARQFKVVLPLSIGSSFEFMLEDDQGRSFPIVPGLLRFSRLDPNNKARYFVKSGYLVKLEDSLFKISEHTKVSRMKAEAQYSMDLLSRFMPAFVVYRMLHYVESTFQRKPVWLICDRPHAAKDNAEHLYRYLLTQDASKRNDIYFLLSPDSPDFERVKEYGRVLKYDSVWHKLKFFDSSFIISAAANNLATSPFGRSEAVYRDLCDFEFVYLRHGVSHNDQSEWLNKLNKNMRILVATCKPEYKGILEGDYGYTEREVRLTGLPRYDNLRDERQKIISILPTWRKNLEGEMIPRTSKRTYVPDFKDTDYFQFYNSLINDKRLLRAMRKHGYKGFFYLHPVFAEQYKDFKSSSLIKVGKGIADYQQIFAESALMVTDFSSVAFDFAYLKKPVIYSQFDEETFYKNHSWGKGYFTYRNDGFGPVTTTLDETVNTLIEYIENDCVMKQEYVDRVEAFFAYTDRNNCKRVYEAIEEVERNRQ